jgi:hypothetical protein
MISASTAVLGEEDLYIGEPSPAEDVPVSKVPYGSHVSFNSESWLACHGSSEKTTKILRRVIDSVRYVRHDEFKECLDITTESVKTQLRDYYLTDGQVFAPNKDAVVLVEKHKSNQWVAELAMLDSKFEGNLYMALGSKDAVSFTTFIDRHPGIKATLRDKTIILFDDASFSGKQLHDHVKAIQKLRAATNIKAIGVVAPFMTEHAARKIAALSKPGCPVFLGDHQHIPTLDTIRYLEADDATEIADAKTELCELWGYTAEEIRNLGLTWFSHKIPNYQSFPQQLAHGSIYTGKKTCIARTIEVIPEVESPYKRSDEVRVKVHHVYPSLRSRPEEAPPAPPIQEIHEARSITELSNFLKKSGYQKHETLVLSDIDDTLVSKETKGLVEGGTTLRVINAMQEHFKILGCTARTIAEGQKTMAQLGSMGITLGTSTTRAAPDVIALAETSTHLYKGIIYAPPGVSEGKGVAVHHLCSIAPFDKIRNVCMIDDKREELEKVQAVCERMGINFIGFHLCRS